MNDDHDFDFDLNMDYMGENTKDGFFRVDDYLPEGVAQPQIKWHAMLQEGATPRNSENPLVSDPQSEQEAPKQKLSHYDAECKDSMTPKLASIVLRSISKEEARVFNRGGDAIRLQRDPMELEIWYQHLYDYLSGRLRVLDESEKSPGIIYRNFMQFLRIVGINADKDQVNQIFITNAKIKLANISYLSYSGFVNALYDIACLLFPGKPAHKLLKAITKQIFPHVMRISDVAKNYGMVKTGFTKIITPYEPELEIFDKVRSPPASGNSEAGVKVGSGHDSPKTPFVDGSFEVPSAGNDNMMGSGSSWTSKFRRSQTRKFSGTIIRRHTGSIMQEAEDEITISTDNNLAKFPQKQESRIKDIYVPVNTSFGGAVPRNEVKLSKFGNAVASEDPKPKFERSRRKKKSVMKKVGRNMLFCTASCLGRLGKWYDVVSTKVVAILTVLSHFIYNRTKGLGRALGFAIEEEHVHTENDEFLIKNLRKDAPAWPVLVDKLLKEIPRAENLYYLKYYKNGLALMFNFANICAILNKLEDFYSFSIVAFSPEIPWFSDTEILSIFQSISWELNFLGSFKSLFWIAVGLVIVTLILSIPSIYYLRAGRLGEDKHGNKAKFPDSQFFLVLIISILAGSSFCQIMKCLLDAFVCDFDSLPWKLQRDSDIICLSDEHLMYMGIGAFSIFAYYPISTFMYPNFQFQDKVLDLKYEPSFLVLNIQARLVLTGLISFFKPTTPEGEASAIFTKLIGTMVILLIMALITLHLRPCLIKGMNLWEVAGYLAAAWINASGLVVYVTENSGIGFAMVISGTVAIFGTTLYVVKRGSRKKNVIKKKKQQPQEQSYVRYDSIKRSATVPEEVKQLQEMKLKKINAAVEEESQERAPRLSLMKNPNESQKVKFKSQAVAPYMF